MRHQGGDAVFALACNYPKLSYLHFVGSLRKTGYSGDIVLAVSPPSKMKQGVEEYIKAKHVVAYAFDVDCESKDSCRFNDDFLGYPDPRPYRSRANVRYALYEYWLQYYTPRSYILILDFRDTFFQVDPFAGFGDVRTRRPVHDLQLFEENYKVKKIGKCAFNALWISRCFGNSALQQLRDKAVLCSGSTLGSLSAIKHYVTEMLRSMDTVQCWRKKIESDQGYQNYLFYTGRFDTKAGKAIANPQGYGVVNTIGAMNGDDLKKEQKGPLSTFWKIRDEEGYVLNYDGNRSAVVHQYDRFMDELRYHLNHKLSVD